MTLKVFLAVFVIVMAIVDTIVASSCNESVCGSVITKCLLNQRCQCKYTDCKMAPDCCRDCSSCLGNLFSECCTCVDMCPERNDTMRPKSVISDFEGLPDLFEIMITDEDATWTIHRVPIKSGQNDHLMMMGGMFNSLEEDDEDGADADVADFSPVMVNCTVIYSNSCTSDNKCSQFCQSMGSQSYRWFYDGCCECVGPNCMNYGINESKCSSCPPRDGEEDLDDDEDYKNEDMLDFGEDDFNY